MAAPAITPITNISGFASASRPSTMNACPTSLSAPTIDVAKRSTFTDPSTLPKTLASVPTTVSTPPSPAKAVARMRVAVPCSRTNFTIFSSTVAVTSSAALYIGVIFSPISSFRSRKCARTMSSRPAVESAAFARIPVMPSAAALCRSVSWICSRWSYIVVSRFPAALSGNSFASSALTLSGLVIPLAASFGSSTFSSHSNGDACSMALPVSAPGLSPVIAPFVLCWTSFGSTRPSAIIRCAAAPAALPWSVLPFNAARPAPADFPPSFSMIGCIW
ncbi:hypothetical protein BLA15945_07391 [Burkholderia lata]|uniref:Uncharacterized protein n=1 Tax=Burkholderia lata (strain ATCC 17760 / DSM 23089 / LMG 22485 / NCIMB 9086 / R18194 / 383) TaxID=482957 RepID=A0A6P2S9Z5_BURL3|nr:hypothetical protein BLA15945_07391 [Burkholderia lata]